MIVTPLLQLATEKQASDLFFSVGAPVNIKIEGVVMPVNAQILDGEIVRRITYELMGPNKDPRVRSQHGNELFAAGGQHRQFSCQCLQTARLHQLRDSLYQNPGVGRHRVEPARDSEQTDHGKARTGARGWRDRIRKIDHACLHDPVSQHRAQRPHPDYRRPARVSVSPQQMHRQPARDRHRHQVVRRSIDQRHARSTGRADDRRDT